MKEQNDLNQTEQKNDVKANQPVKKKKKDYGFFVVLAILGSYYGAGFVTGTVNKTRFNNIVDKQDALNRFCKDWYNNPMTLRNGIAKKPIEFCIAKEGFSASQCAEIEKRITNLDEKLTGLKFNIVDENNKTSKTIVIKPLRNLSDDYGEYGHNEILISNLYGMIVKSKGISLDPDMPSKDLGMVVEHEICHTFGLKDLEDEEYDDSLMYYAVDGTADGITDREVYILNYVYKANEDNVSCTPTCLLEKLKCENFTADQNASLNKFLFSEQLETIRFADTETEEISM